MKTVNISKEHNITRFFVRMVERGDRYTTNIGLAEALAKKNGTAPINYISKKIRDIALLAKPSLKLRAKKEKA